MTGAKSDRLQVAMRCNCRIVVVVVVVVVSAVMWMDGIIRPEVYLHVFFVGLAQIQTTDLRSEL